MGEPTHLLILQAMRVAGVLDTEALASRLGAGPDLLDSELSALQAQGLTQHRTGRLVGWSLTARGRIVGEQMLSAQLDALGTRPRMEHLYRRFLELNPGVLTICTDWQVVRDTDPRRLNDHSDHDYDSAVLDRLATLHRNAAEVLGDLAAAWQRFDVYPDRLGRALARARAGEVDWVTRPTIDSYHTVWFELHEDLLATLGRQRTDEARDRGAPAGTDTALRDEECR